MRMPFVEKIGTEFEVQSDGRTVWVNSAVNLARFSPHGAEINRSIPFYIHAAPGKDLTLTDWVLFQMTVQKEFGVVVDDRHRPEFLRQVAA